MVAVDTHRESIGAGNMDVHQQMVEGLASEKGVHCSDFRLVSALALS